jgi:carbon storage regulator
MLVLSRQRDETIVLSFGEATDEELLGLRECPIRVTTVDIRGDKVRTGISAPTCVKADREEIYRARQAAKAKTVPTSSQTRAAVEAALKR